MKRRDDCQGQIPDQLEHFELMSDVEVVCRLVQDQQARFLRKRTSDHDSLALAPRKGSQMSIGKAVQVQPFKRIANDPFVTRAVADCKSLSMRRAPEADDLPDGKRESQSAVPAGRLQPFGKHPEPKASRCLLHLQERNRWSGGGSGKGAEEALSSRLHSGRQRPERGRVRV